MSKHTPGPWVVTDTRGGGYPGIMREVRDDKGNVTNCRQVYPFYACAPEDQDFPRHSADSKLIAAAPDMLEALYRAEDGLAGVINSWRQENGDIASTRGALKAVRDAIAKATGSM